MGRRSLTDEEREALRQSVDIVQVLQTLEVAVRRVGRFWTACCPFHPDDTEFSLSLRRNERTWRCRVCGAGGDVLDFVQRHEHLTTSRAAARLAVLTRPSAAPAAAEPSPYSTDALLQRVMKSYRRAVRESTEGQQYLNARGLDSLELWDAFRIGWAGGRLTKNVPRAQQDALRKALIALGVLDAQGQDRFTGCIVVPLSHPDHGLTGLYGRRVSPGSEPRHVWLANDRLGVFNWQALQDEKRIFVARGVIDALSMWLAGCTAVTCLIGQDELPPQLPELLVRFGVREVCLVLDEPLARRLSQTLEESGICALHIALPRGQDANALLTERGAVALTDALRQVSPFSRGTPGPPVQREESGDGFILTSGDTRYQVTPRPPFSGRMRVTLRVSHAGRRFYNNFDLFSQHARALTINQVVRLGLSRTDAERHLQLVTEETEKWVADQAVDETSSDVPRRPPEVLGDAREEALEFLRRPDLSQAILDDMDALGYVGEEHAKLLAYLISVSRKLERPLSGIVMSSSGAGKSALAELIESLTPPENVVLYSRLSAQALGYMPRDFLRRKLIILEERVGAEAADYQIRVLQSRQRLSQGVVVKDSTTGKMLTRHIEVEGPIAYLETTTSARINHENATRCFEIHLDESEAQTRRIHQRQREMRMEGWGRRPLADPIRQRHHNAQRLLEPVRVLIPFGAGLSFPSRWLRTRRDHERFLSLIDAAAFLHQYQRESGEMEENGHTFRFIRANIDDYRLAWQLAREVLRSTLHELSREARELLDAARGLTAGQQAGTSFTRRDLRDQTGWLDHRTRTALQELVQMEYLEVIGGSQGTTYQYRVVPEGDGGGQSATQIELTTPDELAALLAEGR